MRTLKFLLRKEFRQVFRDPSILRIIFVMPMIQLLVLPWAADYEVKNIQLSVVDHDHSTYSQQLINKITSSGYFILEDYSPSYNHSLHDIEKDKADLVLEIPASFEKNLVKENESVLFLAVNAINGVKAILGASYLQAIVQDFNYDVREDWIFRLDDANEAILVLLRALQSLFVLLELVERDHAGAKTQADELMTAADREHRRSRLANERAEGFQNRGLVVIKVAQRAAEHDRVGLKVFGGGGDLGQVRHFGCRALH